MYRNKKSGIIGIIITIIILILLVILSNINLDKLSYVENAFSNIVMPIQNGLTYLKNKIAGNNTFFSDINNLKSENEELKNKNSSLEQSLRELEMLKSENATLKEYLNLTEKYGEYKTVPAYVINKDITNYNSVVVINVGSKDGITTGMTVISDKGLVGHIISVTDTTSKVQTIVDTASAVSCTISTTQDGIIARGTLDEKSKLKATYIPTEANLVQGDSVETSGLGGIYPKGIHVGTIGKIVNTKNITDRYALIDTAVDFEKLNTVLVIIK
ncbi:MAG: rod shape-determining protein MreC [Clostridia bacterium]